MSAREYSCPTMNDLVTSFSAFLLVKSSLRSMKSRKRDTHRASQFVKPYCIRLNKQREHVNERREDFKAVELFEKRRLGRATPRQEIMVLCAITLSLRSDTAASAA